MSAFAWSFLGVQDLLFISACKELVKSKTVMKMQHCFLVLLPFTLLSSEAQGKKAIQLEYVAAWLAVQLEGEQGLTVQLLYSE